MLCEKLFNIVLQAGEKHKNDEMMDVLGNVLHVYIILYAVV